VLVQRARPRIDTAKLIHEETKNEFNKESEAVVIAIADLVAIVKGAEALVEKAAKMGRLSWLVHGESVRRQFDDSSESMHKQNGMTATAVEMWLKNVQARRALANSANICRLKREQETLTKDVDTKLTDEKLEPTPDEQKTVAKLQDAAKLQNTIMDKFFALATLRQSLPLLELQTKNWRDHELAYAKELTKFEREKGEKEKANRAKLDDIRRKVNYWVETKADAEARAKSDNAVTAKFGKEDVADAEKKLQAWKKSELDTEAKLKIETPEDKSFRENVERAFARCEIDYKLLADGFQIVTAKLREMPLEHVDLIRKLAEAKDTADEYCPARASKDRDAASPKLVYNRVGFVKEEFLAKADEEFKCWIQNNHGSDSSMGVRDTLDALRTEIQVSGQLTVQRIQGSFERGFGLGSPIPA